MRKKEHQGFAKKGSSYKKIVSLVPVEFWGIDFTILVKLMGNLMRILRNFLVISLSTEWRMGKNLSWVLCFLSYEMAFLLLERFEPFRLELKSLLFEKLLSSISSFAKQWLVASKLIHFFNSFLFFKHKNSAKLAKVLELFWGVFVSRGISDGVIKLVLITSGSFLFSLRICHKNCENYNFSYWDLIGTIECL